MTTEKKDTKGVKEASKKAKSLLWIGGILALFVLAGSITSIRMIYTKKGVDSQSQTPETIEEATEQDNTESTDQEEVVIEEDFEEQSQFISWDELGIPEVYIEYSNGVISRPVPTFEWQEGGIPNFLTVLDSSESAIESYVNSAVQEGWNLEWEREVMGSEDNSWAISKTEDDTLHSMQLNWYSGDSSFVSIILTSTPLEQQIQE